jgi:hypothetical protein
MLILEINASIAHPGELFVEIMHIKPSNSCNESILSKILPADQVPNYVKYLLKETENLTTLPKTKGISHEEEGKQEDIQRKIDQTT